MQQSKLEKYIIRVGNEAGIASSRTSALNYHMLACCISPAVVHFTTNSASIYIDMGAHLM
jgi:predicted Zn-dependent protease